MNINEKMRLNESYVCYDYDINPEYQIKAKNLIYDYNNTRPDEKEKRKEILKNLIGTYNENVIIEPSFRCDYGFNIHFKGFALINYNCVMLDTSPIYIGNNVFIAPGCVLSCAGHTIDKNERNSLINTSSPINIEDNVWLGANVTVCPGITIGEGSIIGAGSVVNKDIPSGVVAVGNPCKVLRKITDKDKLQEGLI